MDQLEQMRSNPFVATDVNGQPVEVRHLAELHFAGCAQAQSQSAAQLHVRQQMAIGVGDIRRHGGKPGFNDLDRP
ncbi:hypothetical protein OKW49_007662 [Paraburkholderia youngii]